MNTCKPTVALVDDHILVRNGLASVINNFGNHDILFEADNGKQCVDQLKAGKIPSLILLDINMPQMNGYDTAAFVRDHYPEIKMLALSMYDSENSIIRMLRNGAGGYILKDIEPLELNAALNAVLSNGYYYSEMITSRLIHKVNDINNIERQFKQIALLNERENEFIKLVCSEMTYKEIAERMCVSPRTVDGYRDMLFEKLNVKTRVGLVLYAIRYGLFTI
jgi:two-component system invasion response regulator UvrY